MTSSQRIAIIVFGSLLATCVALLIISNFLGPVAQESVASVSRDGFKTVLGAMVGALSVILGGAKK
ncbi:hypothetical protein [Ancylobacter terrae]|uniref:hypothetical protein n=1 Tax=Ancylobacter sp. sgz301288 TaxID=3342077 RepID=UPI00385BE943